MEFFGGIEAGGTKFICMIGSSPIELVAETRFPTTKPEETIQRAVDFFSPYAQKGELAGVGIASFGPVDLNPNSPTYGYITSTPKAGWQCTNLLGGIKQALNVPVAFDTDVNAAAFGEQYWFPENHARDPFIYVTVGTGIGVGVIVNHVPIHGLIHPEAGHMVLPHDRRKDPFAGICPFHGDCLEGLASGLAINKRWGHNAEDLPDSHPAWALEVEYISFAIVNLIYAYSPQRIVLGGGVAQHPGLHQSVRQRVQQVLGGYIQSTWVVERIDEYIIPPALGNHSGGLGAMALVMKSTGRINQ